MTKLSLAYFGSSSFSAVLLEKLITDKTLGVEIKLVVSQPDKPVGRKQIITPTPVKLVAQKYGINVFDNVERLTLNVTHPDLALVYAYGKIIPSNLLSLPKHGFWNIHPSLLPKYRGPSPIAYPLILGDRETGVSLIRLDDQLDHGPIIAQEKYLINSSDRRPDLETKLTNLGFTLLKNSLISPTSPNFPVPKPQDESLATYTRRLKKSDGFIPLPTLKKALAGETFTPGEIPTLIKEYLDKYPQEKNLLLKKTLNFSLLIFNLFRGLYPWPGIWTTISINKHSNRVSRKEELILKITDLDFVGGKLILKRVQLEGKREVDFKTFNQAYKIF